MQSKEHMMRATAEDLKAQLAAGGDRSDWRRVRDMTQAEVEALADADDGPLPDGWADAIRLHPRPTKTDIHVRLDSDILDWFKKPGPGYQTRINAALRAFVAARQR